MQLSDYVSSMKQNKIEGGHYPWYIFSGFVFLALWTYGAIIIMDCFRLPDKTK